MLILTETTDITQSTPFWSERKRFGFLPKKRYQVDVTMIKHVTFFEALTLMDKFANPLDPETEDARLILA